MGLRSQLKHKVISKKDYNFLRTINSFKSVEASYKNGFLFKSSNEKILDVFKNTNWTIEFSEDRLGDKRQQLMKKYNIDPNNIEEDVDKLDPEVYKNLSREITLSFDKLKYSLYLNNEYFIIEIKRNNRFYKYLNKIIGLFEKGEK